MDFRRRCEAVLPKLDADDRGVIAAQLASIPEPR
jgi:hypothetical protein